MLLNLKIDQDVSRFKRIVKGQIRKNLKKFVSSSDMIGRQGKKMVSIPVPQIDIPHFKFSDKQDEGVGQGEGEGGKPVDGENGEGKAGNQSAGHALEVDLEFDEVVQILGEELELPNIEPKANAQIEGARHLYRTIQNQGPRSLRHHKRTFKQALKRSLVSDQYNPKDPIIIPYKEDWRYKGFKSVPQPNNQAVIIYMMDVSGSMGDKQKEIVRLTAFWLDAWLSRQYKGLEKRFIIHDAKAAEVDEHTFFHTKESGGTIISSAYKLCQSIIEKNYLNSEWNIYPFHFSDGDNWSANDTHECLKIIKDYFLERTNAFCYGQVESEYGSGQFLKDLQKSDFDRELLLTSHIKDKDDITKAIKDFLGKGN